jgi:hypothetical protein
MYLKLFYLAKINMNWLQKNSLHKNIRKKAILKT